MKKVYFWCNAHNKCCDILECNGFDIDKKVTNAAFKPYFDESNMKQINTASEERTHRREVGGCAGDFDNIRTRWSENRKNKEEIIAKRYSEIGVKYPKGKNVRFDEKNNRFVPILGVFLLFQTLCFAGDIPGLNYLTIEIGGITYEVPDANQEYRQRIYYLKKAIGGDRDAVDILVGNRDYEFVYIGDSTPRWAKVTKDGN